MIENYNGVEIFNAVENFKTFVILRSCIIIQGVNFPNSPTLRLLNSSTVVAISGALRLHIAFLFAGIEPKIMVYLATKLFINSVLYDFKDIKGDTAAGIKTLPICFGKDRIRKILLMLCSSLHISMIIAFLMGFIRREVVILSYSFLVGACASFCLTGFEVEELGIRKYAREILIDGESAIALVLRSIINSLF